MSKKLIAMLVIAIVVVSLVGCGPPPKDQFVEVRGNEALLVKELPKSNKEAGETTQELGEGHVREQVHKLNMVQHDYGWSAGSLQWVSTEMVIIVGRAETATVLTKDAFTGDTAEDEALDVSSSDGIRYAIGVNIGGKIERGDEWKYVYYYDVVPKDQEGVPIIGDSAELNTLQGFNRREQFLLQSGYINREKKRVDYVKYVYRARPLSEVLRTDVAGFVHVRLSERAMKVPLAVAMTQKTKDFEEIFAEAKVYFKERGITLTTLGNVKGFSYENPKVQAVIDSRFSALKDVTIALKEEEAQVEKNQRLIRTAKADRDVAVQFLANYPAMRQEFEIEFRKLIAERQDILQRGWDGKSPANVLPANDAKGNGPNFLLQLQKDK